MPTCPVCGLPGSPHLNHSICCCCGVAFGTDDQILSHQRLMQLWIMRGCRWFGSTAPADFDAYAQLLAAGLISKGGADLRASAEPQMQRQAS